MTPTTRWTVTISLFEDGDLTKADAVLRTTDTNACTGTGPRGATRATRPYPRSAMSSPLRVRCPTSPTDSLETAVVDIEAATGTAVRLQS